MTVLLLSSNKRCYNKWLKALSVRMREPTSMQVTVSGNTDIKKKKKYCRQFPIHSQDCCQHFSKAGQIYYKFWKGSWVVTQLFYICLHYF